MVRPAAPAPRRRRPRLSASPACALRPAARRCLGAAALAKLPLLLLPARREQRRRRGVFCCSRATTGPRATSSSSGVLATLADRLLEATPSGS